MSATLYPACILDHLGDVDAVVVSQSGPIDMPEGYRLVSTKYVHGKRVREFELIKE